MAVGVSNEAAAQLRWGLMAGTNFNKTPLSVQELKSSQYMTGFQIGPVAEFGIPLGGMGLAAEAGILFSQKGAKFQNPEHVKEVLGEAFDTFKSNYVEVPVSAKLYFSVLPAVRLFVKAGPSFNLNITRKPFEIAGKSIALPSGYEKKSVTVALNAGVGVEVLRFLQVSALYSASMTPDYKFKSVKSAGQDFIDAKNKGFVLSAALLF